MGYLANFIVYTLAMVGVIVVALLVFKNSTGISTKNSSKFLRVKDTLSLSSRKTLYIISAGNEDFLLASDFDKTSFENISDFQKHWKRNTITPVYPSFALTPVVKI